MDVARITRAIRSVIPRQVKTALKKSEWAGRLFGPFVPYVIRNGLSKTCGDASWVDFDLRKKRGRVPARKFQKAYYSYW